MIQQLEVLKVYFIEANNDYEVISMLIEKGLSKSLVLGGYHEIFKNKKPQINADKRGFVIPYLRSFALICGFLDSNTKRFCTHTEKKKFNFTVYHAQQAVEKLLQV